MRTLTLGPVTLGLSTGIWRWGHWVFPAPETIHHEAALGPFYLYWETRP